MKLADKVAIVTGGARGIGAAIARRYAAEGACVVVADRRSDEAEALAGELGGGAIAVPFEATNRASIEALVARTTADLRGQQDSLTSALRELESLETRLLGEYFAYGLPEDNAALGIPDGETSVGEYPILMPMTTEQSLIGGREINGEPKKLAEVVVTRGGANVSGRASAQKALNTACSGIRRSSSPGSRKRYSAASERTSVVVSTSMRSSGRSSRRRAATGFIEYAGSSPFGRPRCEHTATCAAPRSSSKRSVGSEA